MPATYVQSKRVHPLSNDVSNTISATFGAPVTAGNLLVGFLSSNGGQTPTFGDDLNGSNAWSVAVTGSVWVVQRICFFPNTVGGACTVTATWPGTRQRLCLIVAEYSGIALVSPYDVGASSGDGGAGSTTATSTAATTTANNDLVVAGLYGAPATVITAGTSISFTKRETGQDAAGYSSAFEDGAKATAGSVEGDWTLSDVSNWAVCMATFKAVAAPAAMIFIQG